METSDGDLVRAIMERRDHASEIELCRRFGPRARLYGRKHLRDDERAKDLSQAVMVVVLEAARSGRIEDPDHVDRFVLGTCRNVARRMRQTDAKAEPVSETSLETISMSAESMNVEAVDVGALMGCLERLDARSRSVLHLAFMEERKADEIASLVALTAGNVRVVRHRALHQLRECLDRPRGQIGAPP